MSDSSGTDRENPFQNRSTDDLERVSCQYEDECEAPANLWATWPEDREIADDGTPVCHTHADEIDRSGDSVLFTTMTASEQYDLTETERDSDE